MHVGSDTLGARNEVALVTGASGSIGVWVCRELREQGFDVVAVDSRPEATGMSASDGVRFVPGDVGDLPGLVGLAQEHRVDVVVHLAAMIAQSESAPNQAVTTNVVGTVNLLEVTRLAGCRRMVFPTSRAALGPIDGVHAAPTFEPVAEDFPRNPVNLYGATKLSAESLAAVYARRYGLDVVGLRFPAIYGPGRLARHGGYAFHSRMIEAAAAGEAFELAEGADEADDVLFVLDAARAVALACTTPTPAGERLPVYNISSGTMVRPVDFADELRRRFPGWDAELGTAPSKGSAGYRSFCRFDDRAARRDLGYSPKYDLGAGIGAYLDVVAGR